MDFLLDRGTTGLSSVQKQRPTERQQLRLRPSHGRLLFVQVAKTMDEWKPIYARPEGAADLGNYPLSIIEIPQLLAGVE
ncbi:MAG TPA: hypothetical protein VNV87_20335 [Acidimicrobiales bacterium]|nr:hypothetical protein [Acidimicrobiales bacterium]